MILRAGDFLRESPLEGTVSVTKQKEKRSSAKDPCGWLGPLTSAHCFQVFSISSRVRFLVSGRRR
jgi:hypothetical protein